MGDDRPAAPGTSSGRAGSAVLVPVPQAEPIVSAWRARHDPVAAAGVPAHITLIVPWLPPDAIRPADLDDLAEVAATTASWDFALTEMAWFGRRVLWLVPEPDEPFRALTLRLAERFGTPPWEGAFADVVPHLTVGHTTGDPDALERVEKKLSAKLPVRCRAEELWVMVAADRQWKVRARCPLARPTAR